MSTANSKPTYIRLPADIKARIEREAAANGRSVTGEIVYQLRRAYGMPVERARGESKPATD